MRIQDDKKWKNPIELYARAYENISYGIEDEKDAKKNSKEKQLRDLSRV